MFLKRSDYIVEVPMNYYHFEEAVPKFNPRKRLPGLHDSDVNDSKVGLWEYYAVTCTVWSLVQSGHLYYLVTSIIWSAVLSGHLCSLVTHAIWSPVLFGPCTI